MTTRSDPWPSGTPVWASLTVSDIGAATGFYGDLLGWDFLQGTAPDGRVYLTAMRDGHPVAGLGQSARPDTPAHWTTFLATDDMASSVQAAEHAGAHVLVPPAAFDRTGSVALLRDPTGADVGLWQADGHIGAMVTDEPGAMAWNELITPDLDAAFAFYTTVFGYTYADISPPGVRYGSFAVGGRTAGGMGEPSPQDEGNGPPHWLVHFKVQDVDAAVLVAVGHGGEPEEPPFDSRYGRVVVLRGPERERFALLAEATAPSADI